jgi:hypothetical protein
VAYALLLTFFLATVLVALRPMIGAMMLKPKERDTAALQGPKHKQQ